MNVSDSTVEALRLLEERPAERAYEQQMRPLIDQLAQLCQVHGIAAIMHFTLPKEGRDSWETRLTCGPGADGMPIRLLAAMGVLEPNLADDDSRVALTRVLTNDLRS